MDLWQNLQKNWLHFFWLTGETPASLQVIVNRIEVIYFPQITRGRKDCITFRNQVFVITMKFSSICMNSSCSENCFFSDFADNDLAQEIPYHASFVNAFRYSSELHSQNNS